MTITQLHDDFVSQVTGDWIYCLVHPSSSRLFTVNIRLENYVFRLSSGNFCTREKKF